MVHQLGRAAVIVVALAAALGCSRPKRTAAQHRPPRFAREFVLRSFVKGNLHTHTSLSDGDSPPEQVARWYREHGYGFVALTDHNRVADEAVVSGLSAEDFTVIPGEEVSMHAQGREVHIAALCTHTTIGGGAFATSAEALIHGIRAVQEQGGIALINHPNFTWALSVRDVDAFAGASLLEIASGHPYVRSQGDAKHPSHEALWEAALGSGLDLMGAAVDDMHHLEQCAEPAAYPGKGWVFVAGDAPDPGAICGALREGLLYSSTGPSLRRLEVRGNRYTVEPEDPAARVTFLGASGVLARGAKSYELQGDEQWVRARVDTADGKHAWTPAVRVEGESGQKVADRDTRSVRRPAI